jgi:hypothetical protein
VYIADNSNHRIRKVTVSTGIITTIAGTGTPSYSGDNGAATSASLCNPYGVAVDSAGTHFLSTSWLSLVYLLTATSLGNIYIADFNNNCIRKVTISTDIITTIAGTGTSSYSGDNGPATSATLYNPYSVGLDSSGIFE